MPLIRYFYTFTTFCVTFLIFYVLHRKLNIEVGFDFGVYVRAATRYYSGASAYFNDGLLPYIYPPSANFFLAIVNFHESSPQLFYALSAASLITMPILLSSKKDVFSILIVYLAYFLIFKNNNIGTLSTGNIAPIQQFWLMACVVLYLKYNISELVYVAVILPMMMIKPQYGIFILLIFNNRVNINNIIYLLGMVVLVIFINVLQYEQLLEFTNSVLRGFNGMNDKGWGLVGLLIRNDVSEPISALVYIITTGILVLILIAAPRLRSIPDIGIPFALSLLFLTYPRSQTYDICFIIAPILFCILRMNLAWWKILICFALLYVGSETYWRIDKTIISQWWITLMLVFLFANSKLIIHAFQRLIKEILNFHFRLKAN